MATVNKDFKIKQGLIVEGATATVNGNQVLTETASDQYIIDLIGGETLVTSVNSTQLEVVDGELSVKSGVFDADGAADTAEQNAKDYADGLAVNYDAAGAASSAQTNAENYADGVALTAENNAKGYADGLAVNYDPAGSASSAQSAAQSYADGLAVNYDAAGAASTAESNANSYTNQEITTALTTAQGYANTAESNANGYTDGEITTALSTAQGYADQAESNANAYTDNAVSGLNWKQAVNLFASTPYSVGDSIDGHALGEAQIGYRILLTGQTNSADNGIYDVLAGDPAGIAIVRSADADTYDELIGSAVYVMEGTQYGSTSWVQSNHYLTDFTGQSWTQFSGQGSVTAGSGITVDGLEVSVNRTTVDAWYDAAGDADAAEAAANLYTDGEITTALSTAQDYADTAEANANSYADSLAPNYDAAGAAQTAEDNAIAHADALTTTDIAEGDNLYFTNQRAIDAVGGTIGDQIDLLTTDDIEEGVNNQYFTDSRAQASARTALVNATKNNIEISQDLFGNLTITAENGVADSTTDDLVEGEENLYFNDERAIDAVSGADIYPNAVIINNLTKQVANQVTVATAGIATGISWAKESYRSAEFMVKVSYGDHTEISKVLMTLDVNDNIAITEYGNVTTNGSASTISADISGTDARLRVTTVNNNSTVTVLGTLIA